MTIIIIEEKTKDIGEICRDSRPIKERCHMVDVSYVEDGRMCETVLGTVKMTKISQLFLSLSNESLISDVLLFNSSLRIFLFKTFFFFIREAEQQKPK